MEGPTIRQRMTLSDQLSLFHSSNLRSKTLTLAAILQTDKNSTAAGRTLLDVIREEESRGASSRWHDLTNRLRIRSPTSRMAGSIPTPSLPGSSDGPIRISLSALMELRERDDEEERVVAEDCDGEVEEGDGGQMGRAELLLRVHGEEEGGSIHTVPAINAIFVNFFYFYL